jgi:hypothetical protein
MWDLSKTLVDSESRPTEESTDRSHDFPSRPAGGAIRDLSKTLVDSESRPTEESTDGRVDRQVARLSKSSSGWCDVGSF